MGPGCRLDDRIYAQVCALPKVLEGQEPEIQAGIYQFHSGLSADGEACPHDGQVFLTSNQLEILEEDQRWSYSLFFTAATAYGALPIEATCDGSAYYGRGLLCTGRSEDFVRPDHSKDAAYQVEFSIFLEFTPGVVNGCGRYTEFFGELRAQFVGECQGNGCEGEPGLGSCVEDVVLFGEHIDAL